LESSGAVIRGCVDGSLFGNLWDVGLGTWDPMWYGGLVCLRGFVFSMASVRAIDLYRYVDVEYTHV
jgi:hypothetical protein